MDLHEDPRFIPTSVRAAVSIRNAAEDPDANEHYIEQLVCAEPIVASALLRMANSAAFRRSEAVHDASQAVRCLGLAHVRTVASQVAMMQLVNGLRSAAARAAAETLLQHSIAVSCFAEQLALAHSEGPRLAALGLFHELPLFLCLARANRDPEAFASAAQICALVAGSTLRSHELIMQELGLAHLAVATRLETSLLDQAHAYVRPPNPLLHHPCEGAGRDALDAEVIRSVQDRADSIFALLLAGGSNFDAAAADGLRLRLRPASQSVPAKRLDGVALPEAEGLLRRLWRLLGALWR